MMSRDTAGAYDDYLRGDLDGALRGALGGLASDPRDRGAIAVAARILAEHFDAEAARELAPPLIDHAIDAGDLAGATTLATTLARSEEDAEALRAPIARAFAKGSKRVTDIQPSPPPLPSARTVGADLATADRATLLARALEALSTHARSPRGKNAKLPRLPLFSALDAKSLATLLGAFERVELPAGETVIAQGREGRRAYVVAHGRLEVVRAGADGETHTLATLGPGTIFGEMALVSEAPRAASVIARTGVDLLAVRRGVLEKLARRTPEIGAQLAEFCRARMLGNLVRSGAILGSVAPEERDALISRFATRAFAAGETLVARGEETAGLFLIANGAVRVVGTDADGDDIPLAELGPGDVVGEISLVLRRPAGATVTAIHPTVALELTRERFQSAIRAHPNLLNELYEVAVKRDEETRSVVAQEALDVSDSVIL